MKSGNSVAGDALDELAYAACYSAAELRYLAESLVAMHDDWQTRNARNIYRQIGEALKLRDDRVRSMCAWALRQIGGREFRAALEGFLPGSTGVLEDVIRYALGLV